MFRMVTFQGLGAKTYFLTDGRLSHDDKLTGKEHARGSWFGKGADLLNLGGEIWEEAFGQLFENKSPGSGERLTRRNDADRRPGYDLSFHVPKSVSVYYAMTGDERVLHAFRESVRATMRDIELEACTRVRRDGANEDRVTGNLVWAEFTHFTARPVNGRADPHLHIHNFVFNATFDQSEVRWKAAQLGGIKRHGYYWEAVALGRLAEKLLGLGFDVNRKGKFWELDGVPESLIGEFSQRAKVINREAERRKVTNPKEKADLGRKTRETKGKNTGHENQREEWRSRATQAERDATASAAGRTPRPATEAEIVAAIAVAIRFAFERDAVVRERVLISAVLRELPGRADADQAAEFLRNSGVIWREHDDGKGNKEVFVTLAEVLEQEREMVQLAQDGRGKCFPLGVPDAVETEGLTREQCDVLNMVLSSTDRVMIVTGRDGSDLTTLAAVVESRIRHGCVLQPGHPFVALSPIASAARDTLPDAGIKHTDTVGRFLVRSNLLGDLHAMPAMYAFKRFWEFSETLSPFRDGVVWVNNAERLSTQETLALEKKAERLNARLVLCGDFDLHGSVSRGSPLRVLATEGGLSSARMETITRQQGEYKDAVQALADGKIWLGYERLERMGCIHQVKMPADHLKIERTPAMEAAAKDYVDTLQSGKSCLAIAPTRRSAIQLTDEIRHRMKNEGLLKNSRVHENLEQIPSSVAGRGSSSFYEPGQVVVFTQNVRGFRAGSEWTVWGHDPMQNVVVRQDGFPKSLPLSKSDCWQVYAPTKINIAVGDKLQITRNTRVKSERDEVLEKMAKINPRIARHEYPEPPTRSLRSGSCHEVKKLRKDGAAVLDNGLVLPDGFRHMTHAYCVTSREAQPRSADRVVLYEPCEERTKAKNDTLDEPVAGVHRLERMQSDRSFYVSVSRGKESAAVYTNDRERLRQLVQRHEEQWAGVDILDTADRDKLVREGFVRAEDERVRWREESMNRDEDRGREREFDRDS